MTLIKLALKNVRAKKGRFLLTSLAVLIGVALTTAVFVFTDSLRDTFGDLSGDIESGYDLAVRSEIPFGDRLNAAPVGVDVPDQLRAVDGVLAVQPRVIEFGIVPNDLDGNPVTADGPNIGVNFEDQSPVPRLFLADGQPPEGLNEFSVDVDTFADDNFVLGETYGVQTPAGLVDLTLSGTFTFADPEENALVGAKLVALNTAAALELFNDNRGYDDVTITVAEGADEDAVTAAVNDILPDGLEVVPREVLVDEQAEGFNEFIDIFRTILLVFAFVILLVAAFIIYNVFSIIVGQRIQEIGLLRALGATGKQITTSIAAEALAVGIFATTVGIIAGLPIAWSLQKLLGAVGFGPDVANVPLRPTTIIVAVILGVGLTLASAIWPALKARSVSPMAALRDSVKLESTVERNPLFGGLATLAGVLLVVLGFVADNYLLLLILSVVAGVLLYLGLSRINQTLGRFSLIGLAVVLIIVALTADLRASMLLALLGASALNAFLGMNLMSPLFARPVARALGAPIAQLGVPSKMARENAGRNPERTATAASALMIGLALVTTVAVVASSFKATFADVLKNAVNADWIILGDQGGGPASGFSGTIAADLEALPEVDAVLPVKWGLEAFRTTADNDVRDTYATNLTDIEVHFDIGYVDRNDALFSDTALVIHEDRADDLDVGVGDTVDVLFADNTEGALTVAGIYSDLAIFDTGFIIDSALWAQKFTSTQDLYVTLLTDPNVNQEVTRASIGTVMEDFGQVDFQTKDEFQESQEESVNSVLTVINVLLLLSIILALLGVAITLALSVFERTREIGLTRAVGATRTQIRRMVRGEGTIVALFGGVLGVGLGLVFGIACVQIIPDDFVNNLAIPWGSLIVYLVVAAIAGVVAAWFPARRASKLNVLDAISH